MVLLVKLENLTSYIYRPIFGNAESRLPLFAAQRFNTRTNAERNPVTQLCVNTLQDTKIILITVGV
jgi:hypothetical protein